MTDYREEMMAHFGSMVAQTTHSFSPSEYPVAAARFRRLYSRHLPSDKSAKILDVGCGDGHFLHFLIKEGFQHVEGVDTSEDRLALCRRYVTPHVHQCDAQDWLMAHLGQFDVIACNHLIEHLVDEQLFPLMEAFAKALAPNGRIILSTPNATSPWASYNLYSDLTHRRLFTAESLTQLLALFGFKADYFPDGSIAYDFPSFLRACAAKARELFLKLAFRVDVGGIRRGPDVPLIVSRNIIAVARRHTPIQP
jgi:2-polyprenyl-3-methyl-5-hydroxy-6-metoxy-1,4-benzoquinol methylase